MARTDPSPARRLRGLWAANAVGQFSSELSAAMWKDPDEYVRAWIIRLWTDHEMKPVVERELVRLAKQDPSPVVRLHLASAIQKVREKSAWEIAEALALRAEDREDRNLPFLLWHGIAERMPRNPDRAFAIAAKTPLTQLGDYIYWYAATFGGKALNRVLASLVKLQGDELRRRLIGLALAMETQPNAPMPAAWQSVAPKLYTSDDPRVRRQAERLAAVFGDESLFPRLREILANADTDTEWRRHAFAVLSRAHDRASLPVFLRLLDDPGLRSQALNLLARFDAPEIPEAILHRFETFSIPERAAAMNALTRRPSFALALLDAVATGRFKREQLTAFHVRQLADLRNAEVDKRVVAVWGRIQQTPGEKQTQMASQEKIFNEAPLWAYDAGAGRQHFQKLCAQCHVVGGEGTRVGPELTGAGKNGIRYFLENIIDPDAVVGTDFQVTTIETKAGDAISGLLVNESPTALTIRTTTDQVAVPKADIARRTLSEKSLMPEGLLESLNPREQIELLKFLTNN
jgi:putative heme-binding domain-containing protein